MTRSSSGRSRRTRPPSPSTSGRGGAPTGTRRFIRARGAGRSGCARLRNNGLHMTITFAEKLSRIPSYEPGTSLDDARARAETPDAIKLASNESPFPPHPAVIDAIALAAEGVYRYPDPDSRALRR